MLTRRNFLKLSAAAAGYVLMPGKGWVAMAQPTLLDPLTVPQFISPLPNALDPSFVFTPAGANAYDITIQEAQWDILGAGFGTTTIWGYANAANAGQGPTYPGRTFVVQRDQQVQVQWHNGLNRSGHLLPVDVTLHWADPLMQHGAVNPYTGPVPIVPHLHGGHTESPSDGNPEYWWTSNESIVGPRFEKSLYTYDNDQEAATLWYHDHVLGITRLNVYAGLAGFYLVRDANDTGLPAAGDTGLPIAPYEIPIVIQDRMFTADGQLFYPITGPELPGTAPNPSALPEFFGDVIVVNGKAWPVLFVEPRKYRFRLLNGSDSRFYNLWITSGTADMMQPDGSGPQIIQIGTDDALLYQPVPLDQLTFGPGERADVVIDFTGWQGQTLVMRNNARSPFDKGAAVNPLLDGRIMAFHVNLPLNGSIPDKPLPLTLRSAPITPADVGNSVRTRKLLLFEGTDSYGRLQPMLGVVGPTDAVDGTVQEGTMLWNEADNPITENPDLNEVEVWEVYNTTGDAHPIHVHLVTFQILSRQKFTGTIVPKDNPAHDGTTSLGGILTNIQTQGQRKPPKPNELGWKDTAQMYPGEVTRFVAKFDRPGRYVWHCHILSHEDHEMMRPYHVGPVLDPLALCGPDDGAVISGQATLCWQPVNLAPCYLVQIAKNARFNGKVMEYTVVSPPSAPVSTYTTALTKGTYFWRVRVGGDCTDVYEGEWSETRSFTLI